jgi:hypothetical protein
MNLQQFVRITIRNRISEIFQELHCNSLQTDALVNKEYCEKAKVLSLYHSE